LWRAHRNVWLGLFKFLNPLWRWGQALYAVACTVSVLDILKHSNYHTGCIWILGVLHEKRNV